MSGMVPGLKIALKEHADDVENVLAPLRNCLRETVKFEKGETVDFVRKSPETVDVVVNGKLLYTMDSKVSHNNYSFCLFCTVFIHYGWYFVIIILFYT